MGSAVVFRAPDGTDYAINASARGTALREYRDGVELLPRPSPADLQRLREDDTATREQVKALQPLVDRGLELCPK